MVSIVKANTLTLLCRRITGPFFKWLTQGLSALTLVMYLPGCTRESSGPHVFFTPERPFVKLRLENDAGADLLNPQTPHAMTIDSIVIFRGGTTNRPFDEQEKVRSLYLSEDSIHYVLKIYIDLETRVGESLTGVKFGENNMRDLISARLSWFGGNYSLEWYKVNGKAAGGPNSTFLLIK